jgi:hypothetical protein
MQCVIILLSNNRTLGKYLYAGFGIFNKIVVNILLDITY